MNKDQQQPLKDEARARGEWRGDERARPDRASGHTLPASEDDDERMGDSGEEDVHGGRHPRIISPPD